MCYLQSSGTGHYDVGALFSGTVWMYFCLSGFPHSSSTQTSGSNWEGHGYNLGWCHYPRLARICCCWHEPWTLIGRVNIKGERRNSERVRSSDSWRCEFQGTATEGYNFRLPFLQFVRLLAGTRENKWIKSASLLINIQHSIHDTAQVFIRLMLSEEKIWEYKCSPIILLHPTVSDCLCTTLGNFHIFK